MPVQEVVFRPGASKASSWKPSFGTQSFDLLAYACEFGGQCTLREAAHQAGIRMASAYVQVGRLRHAGLVKRPRTGLLAIRDQLVPTLQGSMHYKKTLQKKGLWETRDLEAERHGHLIQSNERVVPGSTMWRVLEASCPERRLVGDIARDLKLSLPSVSQAVTRLRKRKFLKPTDYHDRILRPTLEGRWLLFDMAQLAS